FYRFSLDKLYEIVTKIQNDKWDDDTIEKPFIPNSLLEIIGKTELKDKSSKLVIKEEEIQRLIQELKNIVEKETD
ncbi:2263_t:CDS:1, partial [Racocetra fulgida]